jgi:hypothetical protein
MNEEPMIPAPPKPVTHRATLDGEVLDFHQDDFQVALDGLMERHPGKGAPDVVSFADMEKAARAEAKAKLKSAGTESARAKWRALMDNTTARERGFEARPRVETIGHSDLSSGPRPFEFDHADMPRAGEVAAELRDRVLAEERLDTDPLSLANTRITEDGSLATGRSINGEFEVTERFGIEPDVFRLMATRMLPARSAADYLVDCPKGLRGFNWSHWARTNGEAEQHVLRTRRGGSTGRVIFACVAPGYTRVDADLIADVLSRELPEGARGFAHYDGYRWRLEAIWHQNLVDQRFCSGEVFKGGLIIRSTDNGTGGLKIQSVVWRNLSRAFVILDGSMGVNVNLRHNNGSERLLTGFQASWAKALEAAPFIRAWEMARFERDEVLVEKSQGTTHVNLKSLTLQEVLAGILTGVLKQGLVEIPGRVADVVPELLAMHKADEAARQYGVSRASIVLALMRYASQVETDPFAADVIREGAGKLLALRKPLPYDKPYRVEEETPES